VIDRIRLILGTANFGNKYGISGGLSKTESHKILDAAWEMGIIWLDTARSYGGSEEIIGKHNKPWRVISKGDTPEDYWVSVHLLQLKLRLYLNHHGRSLPSEICRGYSVYNLSEVKGGTGSYHFPLNLMDQRCGKIAPRFPDLRIARSVFIQGQAWRIPPIMGIPFAHLCWQFVINHSNVDMITFGVDSITQLEEILNIPQYYEINYSHIGEGTWIKPLS